MKRLLIVFLVLVAVAVVAVVVGILASDGPAVAFDGGGSTVLVWRVDGPLVEQVPASGFPFGTYEGIDSMAEIYPALRAARDDDGVAGLALYIQRASFGLAKAQELRRQMAAFREAGKFVECFLETAGEGTNGTLEYYLATGCDRIHLAPAGDLNLLGLYTSAMFFHSAFEKLGIEADFEHVGRFKSASEPFTREEFSEDAELALGALLDDYYTEIVGAVAEARGLEPAAVRSIVDAAPYGAHEALELGLVDALVYPDEFRDRLEERVGGEPRLVRLSEYSRRPGGLGGSKVAVVFALGTIVRGVGGAEPFTSQVLLGSDDMAAVLREVSEDESIDAVVLRIDSPGGSALASDLILREVELTAREKPVVVSMSDVAASGGYYIASRATRIVAEPSTVTGSIGVVAGKLATRGFQRDKLGLTHDGLKRGANADFYASLDPFTPDQEERFRDAIERVYRTFVGHVAEGRGLEPEAVERVAQGRIWSGADAVELGLVDELGGFDRAIEVALEEAGLDPDEGVRLRLLPEPPGFFELLFEEREPMLPAGVLELLRSLPRGVFGPPLQRLEVPPETLRATRPF